MCGRCHRVRDRRMTVLGETSTTRTRLSACAVSRRSAPSEVKRPFRGRERYVVSGKVTEIGREHKGALVVPGEDDRTGVRKVHAWSPALDFIEHGGNERRSDRYNIHPRNKAPQCRTRSAVTLQSALPLRARRPQSDAPCRTRAARA